MEGDDRVRYCSRCSLNVYNLSEMTRAEAEVLVQNHEGRLCKAFYRRTDGTILTKDCPIGAGVFRRHVCGMLVTCIAGLMLLFGTITVTRNSTKQIDLKVRLAKVEPFKSLFNWLGLTPVPPPPQNFPFLMGF